MGSTPIHQEDKERDPETASVSFDATPNVGASRAFGDLSFSQPDASYRFLRRNTFGSVGRDIKKPTRHDSISSIDTTDLLDHRQSPYITRRDSTAAGPETFGTYRPASGSFISRRTTFSTGPGSDATAFANPSPNNNHQPVSSSTRRKSFNFSKSSGNMPKRQGSSSKRPLLNKLDAMPNYDSLEAADRSRDSLAINIDKLNARNRFGSSSFNHREFYSGPRRSRTAQADFFGARNLSPTAIDIDGSDDSDVLGSELPSRRSSSVSSLGDVCLPIDSMGNTSLSGVGCNFDLSYLEEFASNERKEFLNLQESNPTESIFGLESGNGTTSSTAGVNALMGHTVNEIDMDGGRLRPHRIVPWDSTSNMKRSSAQPNISKSSFDRLNKGQIQIPSETQDKSDARQRGIDNSTKRFTNLYDSEALSVTRFTYFREDLEATVHSPSISGILQAGQNFDDLFNVSVYGQAAYNGNTSSRGSQLAGDSVPGLSKSDVTGSRQENDTSGTAPNHTNVTDTEYALPPRAYPPKAQQSASGHTTPGKVSSTPALLSRESSMPGNQDDVPPQNLKATQYGPISDSVVGTEPSPFWLDVQNPTEEEMKVLSKSFGIHPLTTEDIFLGETREKVELFRNYYLVCFCSFDIQIEKDKRRAQAALAEDKLISSRRENQASNGKKGRSDRPRRHKKGHNSELTPLNMYIVVFHEGVITVCISRYHDQFANLCF